MGWDPADYQYSKFFENLIVAATNSNSYSNIVRLPRQNDPLKKRALRTAFLARFIVIREKRKSKTHKELLNLSWSDEISVEELVNNLKEIFKNNGEDSSVVDKDLKKALDHAKVSVDYFMEHYLSRNSLNFKDAITDYRKTNDLLFGDAPPDIKAKGWLFSVKS